MRIPFSDLHLAVLDTGESGDRVWLSLHKQGHHTGAFVQYSNGKPANIVPSTGRTIDCEQIHLLTPVDSQMTRHVAVRDGVTMIRVTTAARAAADMTPHQG